MTSTVLVFFYALWLAASSSLIERKEPNLSAQEMLEQVSHALRRNAYGRRLIASTVRVPSGGGMTNDFCQTSVDCKGDRSCRDAELLSDGDICTGEAECRCDPESSRSCTGGKKCEAGEVCPRGHIAHNCVSESYADDFDKAPLGDGFTMDECSESRYRSCKDPRTCQAIVNGAFEACAGRSGCLCLPPQFQPCTEHRQCPFGEACASSQGRKPVCYSEKYVSNSSTVVPLPRKLTLDPCVTGKDCQKPRTCMVLNSNNELKHCLSRSGCFCRPINSLKRCRRSQNCVDGEVCVRDKRTTRRRSDEPYCASQTYASGSEDLAVVDGSDVSVQTAPSENVQTPTPIAKPGLADSDMSLEQEASDDVVCIDAKALHGFDKEELLYNTHQTARVLCDEHGSCATPGHIVLFKGRGMMMRSYCELTSCTQRVMMVNSPKYRRRLLVSSMTTGLQYASLAARYETRGEEMLLSALIRVGL